MENNILERTKECFLHHNIFVLSAICAIILLAIVITLSANSTSAKIKKYDKLISAMNTYHSLRGNKDAEEERDKCSDEWSELLEELGLNSHDGKSVIDENFITEYLKTHSIEEFLIGLKTLFINSYWWDQDKTFNEVLTIVRTAVKVSGAELQDIDLSNPSNVGYYANHKSEYPPVEVSEVSGRFYSSSGENGRTEKKECKVERTYYGDYALEYCTGYNYYEGRYEWVNGKFYDELPQWRPYSFYRLMYKGETYVVTADNYGYLMNNVSTIKYVVLDNYILFIDPCEGSYSCPFSLVSSNE